MAARLVASSDDIDRLATEDAPDIAALHGWRREVFGEDALALKQGRIALGVARQAREADPGLTILLRGAEQNRLLPYGCEPSIVGCVMGDSIRAGVYTRGHKLRLAFLLLALLPIVANGVIAFVSLRDLARSNARDGALAGSHPATGTGRGFGAGQRPRPACLPGLR